MIGVKEKSDFFQHPRLRFISLTSIKKWVKMSAVSDASGYIGAVIGFVGGGIFGAVKSGVAGAVAYAVVGALGGFIAGLLIYFIFPFLIMGLIFWAFKFIGGG